MTDLGPLYHWSPRERLESIKWEGLAPGKPNFHGSEYTNPVSGELEHYFQDSLSFSLDPATAWNYSHGCWASEGAFDLWMVILEPTDDIQVRTTRGARIHEVRVANRISAKRLNWIGARGGL